MTSPRWQVSVTDTLDVLAESEQLVGYAFQSRLWMTTWAETLGRGRKPLIVVVADGGRPLLVLTLTLVRRGGVRIVEPLGGDVTDYHAPLADATFAASLTGDETARLWRDIRGALPRHDLILWPRLPAMLDATLANPLAGLAAARPHGTAWSRALSPNHEQSELRPRFAKRLAQSRRQLERRGSVSLEVTDKLSRQAAVDELILFKQRRWRETGAADPAGDPAFRQFYQHLVASGDGAVEPHLARLRCGGVTVAAHLGVVHRSRFYFLLVGWQGGEWRRYSPGLLLTEALVRHATERKLAVFDFTGGDEPYKLEWADTRLPLYVLEEAGNRRGHALLLARAAIGAARERAKRNPVLRDMVRRVAGRTPIARMEAGRR